ncbi:phage tail protein [Loktanella sp. M215]|uniref:phage tail protein n=1 Tax=Loktanella sp. M215 TaxID=2675431 RepID=UPI001F159682|nr:hypothetical protein [Loktanella sp. M215]
MVQIMAIFSAIAYGAAYLAASAGFSVAAATAIRMGAANLARSFAVSLVLRALTPKPSIPKQQIRATINQATGPRTRLYGQGLLGGTRAFWEVLGNGLYQIIVMNHGRLDGLISYWLDGKPVTVVDGFVTDSIYDNNVLIDFKNGSAGSEGGDYALPKETFPTLWTDDHKLLDQATVFTRFLAPGAEKFNRAFPKGANTDVQIAARGARVYDFRTGTTGYSDNATLCIGDYVSNGDGFRIARSDMDAGIWSAHADLSDTEIVRRAGGTRPLYRLWGTYSLTEEPKSVLARMLTTCNATVYQTAEGKVGIMGGVYAAPDVTITADDIFRFVLIDGTEKLDAFNVVKGIYTSADHDYQDTEAQPWEDITALLTEPERSIQFDADMVPDHGQMRQLMKLELYRQNRPFSLSITTNLVGIKARFPRGTSYHVIRVQNPDMDFDEVCEVVSHKTYAEADGNGVLQWRCQIELVGIDPAWNAWDAITEEGDAPIAPAVLETEGIPVPVISELAQFAAGAGQGVRVTVADISRPDLVFAAQIRLAPSGSWSAMVATDFEAESVGRTIGNTYDVRVKYNGGAYSDPASIEILDPEAP